MQKTAFSIVIILYIFLTKLSGYNEDGRWRELMSMSVTKKFMYIGKLHRNEVHFWHRTTISFILVSMSKTDMRFNL